MATKIINGKTIEFDPEVQSEIYKLLLPDDGSGDANLLDWSIVISGVLLEVAKKNATVQLEESAAKTMNILVNGKAFVIDAGTKEMNRGHPTNAKCIFVTRPQKSFLNN